MKKAVVFYGSMRELEMGSKSWHVLGEDVDYFLVTWDIVNNHYTDSILSYPFDPDTFPRPIKGRITSNFDEYNQSLQNIGMSGCGMLYIMYQWSLIKLLPDIHTYDQIIITRTDIFCTRLFGVDWEPTILPGKVTFAGSDGSINDWLVATDPAGLDALYDLYYGAIHTRDLLDEFNQFKIIHTYLHEKIKANPEKFYHKGTISLPIMVLVRPNYPKVWLELPHGQLLAYLLIRHASEYELPYTKDSMNNIDEMTLRTINTSDFRL